MPTQRPRHMITETERVSRALDSAATIWPDVAQDRAELLRRTLERGLKAVESESTARQKARIANVAAVAGSLPDIWPDDWREQSLGDWPK